MADRTEDFAGMRDALGDYYLSMLEHGNVIFFVVGADGEIDYVSDYIEDILKFSPEFVRGKSIFNLTDPESIEQLRSLIEKVRVDNKKPAHFQDLSLFCTFCNKHYFDGIILPLDTVNGQRYAIYLHDVTARKIDAEKLSRLNLELDSFIYKASHDLRAPLLSIRGLINLAEQSPVERRTDFYQLMKRSIDRLDKFISQLAHYTRNSNLSVNYARINFQELFDEIIETYRYLPNSEKIRFETAIEEVEESASDIFRMKVILHNIVSNAVKYHHVNRGDPFIKISLHSDNRELTIKVIDNGSGIATEKLSNVFDMFKRATDKAEGSGLGLYIVKKALEKLNGSIQVQSEEGIGTTFTIVIPNEIDNCSESLQEFEMG